MPLVQLFSTVLRKDEDGKTYLVTPVEKVGIRVVDAPFVAVEMNVSGEGDEQVITFRTNVGDVVEAGPEHPLRFVDEDETGGLKPYVLVRGRLEALVARPVMYELVEHGEEIEVDGRTMFAVRSQGRGLSDHAGREAEAAERLMDARHSRRRFRPTDFRRARARASAARCTRDDYGDHRFNPGHPRARSSATALRDAAVLIPVVDHGDEATVILTKRAEKLRSHSGQVAFPGGRIDPDRRVAGSGGAARDRGGDRPRRRPRRDHRPHAGLCRRQRLPHRAGAGDRAAGLRAHAQRATRSTPPSRCRCRFLMDPANHARDSRDVERAGMVLLRHALWRPAHLGRDRRHHPHAL